MVKKSRSLVSFFHHTQQVLFLSIEEIKSDHFQRTHQGGRSDSEEEDSISITSSDFRNEVDAESTDSKDDGEQEQSISELVDKIVNKHAAKRIKALQELKSRIQSNYLYDQLENHTSTLLDNLQTLLQRFGLKERILAAEILPLTILTLGYQTIGETAAQSILSDLETKILEGSISSNVDDETQTASEYRQKLVEAYSFWKLCIDTPQDLVRRNGTLDIIAQKFWNDNDANVVSASLHGWTMLCSTLSYESRLEMIYPRYRPILVEMLQHASHSDVKVAVGEALCILYEAYHAVGSTVHEDEDEESKELDNLQILITDIEKIISDGVNKKSSGKKESKHERSNFRHYLATIEHGYAPPREEITINKMTATFEDWESVLLYRMCRSILGSGIVQHLQSNEILRELLHAEGLSFDKDEITKLTALEKKKFLSKNSDFNKKDTLEKNKKTRSSLSLSVYDDQDEDE